MMKFRFEFALLALSLAACAPVAGAGYVPPTLDARAAGDYFDGVVTANAQATAYQESADEQAFRQSLTSTALPPQYTAIALTQSAAQLSSLRDMDNATSTASVRATGVYQTRVAQVATDNEGSRRAMDAQRIYDERQAQKEFDARFWPIFWRVFWIAFTVSVLVVGVWIGQAYSFRVRADSYAKEVEAQGEADAKKIKATAEAREIRARAKRWEMIQTRDGIYIPDGAGQYKFVEMTRLSAPMSDTIPPVPPLPKIGATKVYTPLVANVLDFLDRCAEIVGPDAVKLPSAEEINNSTLRNAGLGPLSEAGLVSTSQGRGRGTFILGYKSIADLRVAVESGLAPLPESVPISAN